MEHFAVKLIGGVLYAWRAKGAAVLNTRVRWDRSPVDGIEPGWEPVVEGITVPLERRGDAEAWLREEWGLVGAPVRRLSLV